MNNTYKGKDFTLNGYSLLSADGVCLYYKETLALIIMQRPYLNEILLSEVKIGSKKCITGTVYWPPSLNSEKFESFL